MIGCNPIVYCNGKWACIKIFLSNKKSTGVLKSYRYNIMFIYLFLSGKSDAVNYSFLSI